MHWILNGWKRLLGWKRLFVVGAIVLLSTVSLMAPANAARLQDLPNEPWEVVALPTQESMLDLAFTSNPNHGWMVGTNSTLLETFDGGQTWKERQLDLGTQKYRFSAVSFAGDEGWVAGQPAILLHTPDGGQSWERMPLSEKLPGSPEFLEALGQGDLEMVTDVGAIYHTTDGALNWKAMVDDAFGVVRSLHRSADGQYIAVSSRGNFFSIWKPGSRQWEPFNRNSSRRLQNMGFTPDDRLWIIARGGSIQFTNSPDPEDWQKAQAPESFNSWGFLDMAYRTNDEVWIVGGSGSLLVSFDNGQTWYHDAKMDQDVPANLYKIEFLNENNGYILGQRGTFLRYRGATA